METGRPPGSGGPLCPSALRAVGHAARTRIVELYLCQELARSLNVPPAYRISTCRPLRDQGLDSITALQLNRKLENALRITVRSAELLRAGTVTEAAAHLARLLQNLPDEKGHTMTSTTDDVAARLSEQLQGLSDRAEITQLCDSYVMHLDKDRENDAWLDSVFTDDVVLTFPMGEYKGMEGLADFQQMARTTFERTHHISTNHDVELDGDQARVQAHLLAVHVPRRGEPAQHFDIGGHYEALVVRTDRGWRIRRFSFDLVWTSGEGPG